MRERGFKCLRLLFVCACTVLLSATSAFAGPSLPEAVCGMTGFDGKVPSWIVSDNDTWAADDAVTQLVTLDISQGSIYISENGYCIGDNAEETPFKGVYKITGNSEQGFGIRILGGEHTVILDNADIDQRTLRQCYPLVVDKDSVLHLYLRGENTLFAGSGYSGITLSEGASLDIHGFGQGSLSLLAYPEKYGESFVGASAIDLADTAVIDYPCAEGTDDEVIMYGGTNRLSFTEITQYENQPYLKIQYSIKHECHILSEEPDCTRAQYCLECGRETAPKTEHIPGEPAGCTTAQTCVVCGHRLAEPLGHRGVWKTESSTKKGTVCVQETMTCTVCGEVLVRDAVSEE